MIRRYSSKQLETIFSDSEKYKRWLRIEESVLKYFCSKNHFSKAALDSMLTEMVVVPRKIRELEKTTKHDVVAFVNYISRSTTQRERKWIHYGMTSSDLVDTGNSMALKQANELIISKAYLLLYRLRRMAMVHKYTYCLDRASGINAKGLTTFGCRLAEFYEDIDEAVREFERYRKHVECVSISGSMGIFSHIDPELQDFVAKDLDLYSASCSTQVLNRDRYVKYFQLLNRIVQAIHRLSLSLRLLSRTEVGEVWESFHTGQVGSSSMPHKRNPISLENICGLCRLFNSYYHVTSKNVPIWLERDISHSSVDRVVFLDATTLALQAITKMERVLKDLYVDDERMKRNIMEIEYQMCKKGMVRLLCKELSDVMSEKEVETHLDSVYEAARHGRIKLRNSFEQTDLYDHLGEKKTDELFDLRNHVVHVDGFFKRLFSRDSQRQYFSTIFYEEEAILNSIDSIALSLNSKYVGVGAPVKLLAVRNSSSAFLSNLLLKLNFPVDLQVIDASRAWFAIENKKQINSDMLDVSSGDVKGKEVILLDGLANNETFIKSFRKVISSYKPKSLFITTLFVENDRSIFEGVDLFGLLVPTSDGIAGFGIDNGEGGFRNLPMVGKLCVEYLPLRKE